MRVHVGLSMSLEQALLIVFLAVVLVAVGALVVRARLGWLEKGKAN